MTLTIDELETRFRPDAWMGDRKRRAPVHSRNAMA